jgi:anti-sigma regulatory factor (Ser/Thr protein kinase)
VGLWKKEIETNVGGDTVIGALGVLRNQHVSAAVVGIGPDAVVFDPAAADRLPPAHYFEVIALRFSQAEPEGHEQPTGQRQCEAGGNQQTQRDPGQSKHSWHIPQLLRFDYSSFALQHCRLISGLAPAGRIGRPVAALALTLGLFRCAFMLQCAAAEPDQLGPPRLQSIESAIQVADYSTHPVPVVVRGIVILNRRQMVIEDRTGATEVEPLKAEQIALGDEVEVSGLMTLAPQPRVEQGQVRRLWGGSMPLPLSITPDQAADGENELFLVQTVAKLVNFAPAGLTGVRLNLRGGHQSFSAVLPNDSLGGEMTTKSMQPDATLRLTGILMINHGVEADHGDVFTLQLRNPDDIELVEAPSWWTQAHLLLVGAAGVILILTCILGYYRIKHSRYRAVAEERANIARDIHDTLAQGYAGITLQLEAAQQTIQRDPERAEVLLNEALQLVRHSRDESHLSIDVLRSLSRNDRLDVLISHCIVQIQAASGAMIEQQVSGEAADLSYHLVNNLFRIAQEAIANAVHHANADRIVVRVEYRKKETLLEVEDNGIGFDPGRIPGTDQGHFGLTGMRERCAAINAEFELRSTSSGTLVRVKVAS